MFAPVKDKWVSGKYGQMNERQLKNFMAKIDGDPFHPTECALWTGRTRYKIQKKGKQHGVFDYHFKCGEKSKCVGACALMYHNFVGPLPSIYGQTKKGSPMICHRCDTDGRCVNINHLYIGTAKDNAIDMARDGNQHMQKLSQQQVREIRALAGTMPQWKIAEKYGVVQQTISKVIRREFAAWLD